jgi:hypothetical protein
MEDMSGTILEQQAKPVRVQRRRVKGWKMPPNTVYVGRPSRFANPWKVGQFIGYDGGNLAYATAEDVVGLYRCHATDPDDPTDVSELRGKNLACWCRLDQPCHADVLLELANSD